MILVARCPVPTCRALCIHPRAGGLKMQDNRGLPFTAQLPRVRFPDAFLRRTAYCPPPGAPGRRLGCGAGPAGVAAEPCAAGPVARRTAAPRARDLAADAGGAA